MTTKLPATEADSLKAPIVVGSGDWLGHTESFEPHGLQGRLAPQFLGLLSFLPFLDYRSLHLQFIRQRDIRRLQLCNLFLKVKILYLKGCILKTRGWIFCRR